MTDLMADAFEEEGRAAPEPATLEKLMALAEKSRDLQREIDRDTVALEEKRGEHEKIVRDLIPSMMDDLGMAEFKLNDGAKVEVKEDVKCGISEANKPTAFAWLRSTDNDGIIKTKVETMFGRGEAEAAQKAQELLAENGFTASVTETVHPSTLKSFVKEQLENGVNIPLEAFGVYEYKLAKITLPRRR